VGLPGRIMDHFRGSIPIRKSEEQESKRVRERITESNK